MLNRSILMGRLTRDPELRTTPSGVSVASFTLAVDRGYAKAGEERQTDFINIVAWRATAEFVGRYFTKGMMMIVEGRIQSRSWEDQNGNKRYATEVVADNIQFGESKKAAAQHTGADMPAAPAAPAQQQDDGFGDVAGFSIASDDDDLPF
ncbi:MAG: single-stranded DNA-binding protein [Clostridia bacterium]|nr:single-stranded DNA-binding protein [Clostridia bacterium]